MTAFQEVDILCIIMNEGFIESLKAEKVAESQTKEKEQLSFNA
jgi:hypothetical protein